MRDYTKKDSTIARLTLPRYNVLQCIWIRGEGTFYSRLGEKCPHLKKYKKSQIRGFVREFNKEFIRHICKNRAGIKLPYGLGHIFVGTRDYSARKIDYKNSIIIGKKVRHNNLETNSKRCGYTNVCRTRGCP